MDIEPAPDYEMKAVTQLRSRSTMLAMRFTDAADAVEQCGEAIMLGERLIAADDLDRITGKLRFYAEWLTRIADGEPITESQMEEMIAYIDSVNVPKKMFERKHEIIEIAYLGTNPETGRPMRHRLWSARIEDNEEHFSVPTLSLDMNVVRGKAVESD